MRDYFKKKRPLSTEKEGSEAKKDLLPKYVNSSLLNRFWQQYD
jgi:hypothetical protein